MWVVLSYLRLPFWGHSKSSRIQKIEHKVIVFRHEVTIIICWFFDVIFYHQVKSKFQFRVIFIWDSLAIVNFNEKSGSLQKFVWGLRRGNKHNCFIPFLDACLPIVCARRWSCKNQVPRLKVILLFSNLGKIIR